MKLTAQRDLTMTDLGSNTCKKLFLICILLKFKVTVKPCWFSPFDLGLFEHAYFKQH